MTCIYTKEQKFSTNITIPVIRNGKYIYISIKVYISLIKRLKGRKFIHIQKYVSKKKKVKIP